MENKKLTDLSVTELKALAYDIHIQIERNKKIFLTINQEIDKRVQAEQKIQEDKKDGDNDI